MQEYALIRTFCLLKVIQWTLRLRLRWSSGDIAHAVFASHLAAVCDFDL